MDVATHLLVPYAAALVAFGYWRRDEPADRRKAAYAAVFGIAGFSPDLDGILDPLSHVDSLYWLQHRGLSHTAVGAPLFALAALGLLVLGARLWPRRMSLFAWRRGLVPAAVLGSYTHVLLDGVTYGGVPLWWPFADGRWGFPLFHWLVFWLLPVSAIPLLFHTLGKLRRRDMVAAGALVVAILVGLGAFRAAMRPWDEPEGSLVYSTESELEWIVARPAGNGSWELETVRGDERTRRIWFSNDVPPDAEDEVARVLDTDAYRGFLMGSFGPRVTRAEPHPAGGWNVTVSDVVQRYEAMHGPDWAPSEPFEEWGYVSFRVDGDSIEVLHRGW